MIERLVKEHLAARLALPVALEVPEDPPAAFVRVEKTGSGGRDHICRATLAVQSYGGSQYEAAALNERVKAAMEGLAALPQVAAVRLVSDYNFTDTALKRPRYQAVFNVTHYESA